MSNGSTVQKVGNAIGRVLMMLWIIVIGVVVIIYSLFGNPSPVSLVCIWTGVGFGFLAIVIASWGSKAIEAVKANTAALDAHRALMQGIADNTLLTAQEVHALRKQVAGPPQAVRQ